MKGAFYAGGSWAALFLAVLAPGLFAGDARFTTVIASLVVGLQTGQSAVVQVGSALLRGLWTQLATIASACALVIGVAFFDISTFSVPVVTTIAGCGLGVVIGSKAQAVLSSQGSVAYQYFQLRRALWLLSVVSVATVTHRITGSDLPSYAFLGLGCASIALSTISLSSQRRDGHIGVILFGLGASLFYRNDVNWLRASVSGSPDFSKWHVLLAMFVGVQGIVGFAVVHLVLSQRARAVAWVAMLTSSRIWKAIAIWIALSLAALWATDHFASPFVAVTCATLLTIIVGLASGVCHGAGINSAPYIAGILGTSVQLGLLKGGVYPGFALVLQVVIIGLVLVAVGWAMRGRVNVVL